MINDIIGHSALSLLRHLVPWLPRGRGALPRLAGRLMRFVPFTVSTRRGLRLPINPDCFDSYVHTLINTSAWADDVLDRCISLMATRLVMYDVGAHIGYIALHLARAYPTAQVVAFEPQADLANTIGRAAALNSLRNVTVLPLLLGDNNTDSAFLHVPAHRGQASRIVGDLKSRPVPVTMRTLDTLVYVDNLLPPPDLIKIDVEGAELEVIRGATRLISEKRPALVFEHNCASLRYGYSFSDLCSVLSDSTQYTFHAITPGGLIDLTSVSVVDVASFNDFVALPA